MFLFSLLVCSLALIKKENEEIQNGAVAKSYVKKGLLIYEEMRKYLSMYEEAVGHI